MHSAAAPSLNGQTNTEARAITSKVSKEKKEEEEERCMCTCVCVCVSNSASGRSTRAHHSPISSFFSHPHNVIAKPSSGPSHIGRMRSTAHPSQISRRFERVPTRGAAPPAKRLRTAWVMASTSAADTPVPASAQRKENIRAPSDDPVSTAHTASKETGGQLKRQAMETSQGVCVCVCASE